MGTHLRVLNKSYPIDTNMKGFRWFSKEPLRPCALDESSLNSCRVNRDQVPFLAAGPVATNLRQDLSTPLL